MIDNTLCTQVQAETIYYVRNYFLSQYVVPVICENRYKCILLFIYLWWK